MSNDRLLYICDDCGDQSYESAHECSKCHGTNISEYREIDVNDITPGTPYKVNFIYKESIQNNISYIRGRFKMRYVSDEEIGKIGNDIIRVQWSVVIYEKVTDTKYYVTFDTGINQQFMHQYTDEVTGTTTYYIDGMTSGDIYLPILGDEELELSVETVIPDIGNNSDYRPKKFNLLRFIKIPYDLFINDEYQIDILGVTESDTMSGVDTSSYQQITNWIISNSGISVNVDTNTNGVYATVWWKHKYIRAEEVSYKDIVNYKIELRNSEILGDGNIRENFIVSLRDVDRIYESAGDAIFKYRFRIPEKYIRYYLSETNSSETTIKIKVVARRQILRLSSKSDSTFNVRYRRDIEIYDLCVKENEEAHYGENTCFNYDAVDDHTGNYATLNLEFKLKRSGEEIRTWYDLEQRHGTELRVVVFRYGSLIASRKDIFKRLTNMCRSGEIFDIRSYGVNDSYENIQIFNRNKIGRQYGLTDDNSYIDIYQHLDNSTFRVGCNPTTGIFSVSYNPEYMGDNDPRTDLGNNSSYYMVFYVVTKDKGIVYKSERSCNVHILRRPIIRNYFIESSRFGKKRCDYTKGFNMDLYDGSGGDVTLTWGVDRVTLRQWLGLDISRDNKSFGELIKEFFQVTWSNILRNYERTKNILTPVRFDLDMIIKTDFKFVITGGNKVDIQVGETINEWTEYDISDTNIKIGLEYCEPEQDKSDLDYQEPYFNIMIDDCDTDFVDWLLGLDHQHKYTTNMYRFTDSVHKYPGESPSDLLNRAKDIIRMSILNRCVRFAVVPERELYNNDSYVDDRYVYGDDPYNYTKDEAGKKADRETYSGSVYTSDLSNIFISYADSGYNVFGNAYHQFNNTGEINDGYTNNVNNVYSAVFKGYRSNDDVPVEFPALLEVALSNTPPEDIYNMIRVMLDKSYLTFRLSQANLCKNIGGSPIPVVWQCPNCKKLFAVVDNDGSNQDRNKVYILSTTDSHGNHATINNHNVKIGETYYFYKSSVNYIDYYDGDDERKFKNFNTLRSVRKEFRCPYNCGYKPCDHQVDLFPKLTRFIRKLFGNISDDSVGGIPKIGEFGLYDYNSRIDNMIAEVISANNSRADAIWQIILTIIAYTFKSGSRYDSNQTLSEKLSSEYTSIADFNDKTGITAMRNGIKEYNNNMKDYYACTCSECGHRIFMDILYHDGSKMIICPYCKKKNVMVADIDRVNLYEVSNNRDIPIMGHYSPTGDITLINPTHVRYSYDEDSYPTGYIAEISFRYDARETYGKVDGFRVTFIQSNPTTFNNQTSEYNTSKYNLDRSKNELSFINGIGSENTISTDNVDGSSLPKVISIFILAQKDNNGKYINNSYRIIENNNGVYNSTSDYTGNTSVSVSDLTITEDCGCVYVQFKADFSGRTDYTTYNRNNTEDEIVEYLDIDIRAFYASKNDDESIRQDNILGEYVRNNRLIYGSYRVYSYDTDGYDYGIIADKAWQSGFGAIIKKKDVIRLIYPDPRSTNIYYNIPGLQDSNYSWDGCDNPPIGEYHWYGNNMRILAAINDYDRIIGEPFTGSDSDYKIEDIMLISENEIDNYTNNTVREGNLVYNGRLDLYPYTGSVYHDDNPLNCNQMQNYESNVGGFIESDINNPRLKKIVADLSILPGYTNVIRLTGDIDISTGYISFSVIYKCFNTMYISDIYFVNNKTGNTGRLEYFDNNSNRVTIGNGTGAHTASSVFEMRDKYSKNGSNYIDGTGYFVMQLYANVGNPDNSGEFDISLHIEPGYNSSTTLGSNGGSHTRGEMYADGTILINDNSVSNNNNYISDNTRILREINRFKQYSGLYAYNHDELYSETFEGITNRHYIKGSTNSLFRIEDIYNHRIKSIDISYIYCRFSGNNTLVNITDFDKSFSVFNRYGSEIQSDGKKLTGSSNILLYRVKGDKYAIIDNTGSIKKVSDFDRSGDNCTHNIGMNIRITPLCATSKTDLYECFTSDARIDYIMRYGINIRYTIHIVASHNGSDTTVYSIPFKYSGTSNMSVIDYGNIYKNTNICSDAKVLHVNNYGMIDARILIEGLSLERDFDLAVNVEYNLYDCVENGTKYISRIAKAVTTYTNYSHNNGNPTYSRILHRVLDSVPVDNYGTKHSISTNIDRMHINDGRNSQTPSGFNIGLYDNYEYNMSGIGYPVTGYTDDTGEYDSNWFTDRVTDYNNLRSIWNGLDEIATQKAASVYGGADTGNYKVSIDKVYADAAVSIGDIFIYRTDSISRNTNTTIYEDYITDYRSGLYKYTTNHYKSISVDRGNGRYTSPGVLESGDRFIVPNFIYSVSGVPIYEHGEEMSLLAEESDIEDIRTSDYYPRVLPVQGQVAAAEDVKKYKSIYINGIVHYDNRVKSGNVRNLPVNSIMSGDKLVIAIKLVRGNETYCHFTKPFTVHLMEIPNIESGSSKYILSDNKSATHICNRCGREYFIDNNYDIDSRVSNMGNLTVYSSSPDIVEVGVDDEGETITTDIHNDNTIRIVGTRLSSTMRNEYLYDGESAISRAKSRRVEEYARLSGPNSDSLVCIECGADLEPIDSNHIYRSNGDGELHLIRAIESFNGFYGIHHPICDMLSRSEYIYADNYTTTLMNFLYAIDKPSKYDMSEISYNAIKDGESSTRNITSRYVTTWFNTDIFDLGYKKSTAGGPWRDGYKRYIKPYISHTYPDYSYINSNMGMSKMYRSPVSRGEIYIESESEYLSWTDDHADDMYDVGIYNHSFIDQYEIQSNSSYSLGYIFNGEYIHQRELLDSRIAGYPINYKDHLLINYRDIVSDEFMLSGLMYTSSGFVTYYEQ